MHTSKEIRTGFLIFPGFPMACLTSMIEPMRVANEIAGSEIFAWDIISETGQKVLASAKVAFEPDLALLDAEDLEQLYVLSGPSGQFENPRACDGKLRKLARHGVTMGAISGGIFPLARAGLLEDIEVSVHWCYSAAFQAEFPELTATKNVIAQQGRRITVSGAAAAFDLALHLIQDQLGSDVATEVACWFQHPMMRGEGVEQRKPTQNSASTDDMLPDNLRIATELFANHIEDPLKVADVAKAIGISVRQLERMFKKTTGMSPLHYYRAMRMRTARQLVLYSNDSMNDISLAVGYYSSSALVQNYKEVFGIHPVEDREKINMFRVQKNAILPHA